MKRDDIIGVSRAVSGKWLARYVGRLNKWRIAHNAQGAAIECDTQALALSVARYRIIRLKEFEQ